MINFEEYLVEYRAPEVNQAQKLLRSLSSKARNAITKWEYSQWVTGDLEQAYKTKNEVYAEIESAAETLRDSIRAREGNKMVLYRGITTQDGQDPSVHKGRQLSSWTARKEVAAIFAGLGTGNGARDIKLFKDKESANAWMFSMTDKDAKDIQNEVIQKGKAIYKKFLFKTSPNNDNFFEVYKKTNRGYSFFADDYKTNLANWLIRTRDEEIKYQDEVRSKGSDTGYIVKDNILVDDIVWVLNNGTYSGTLEYIVKNNSGLKSKKVKL